MCLRLRMGMRCTSAAQVLLSFLLFLLLFLLFLLFLLLLFLQVLLSFEVLGNPRGLFTKMSTGVHDFFYEVCACVLVAPACA